MNVCRSTFLTRRARLVAICRLLLRSGVRYVTPACTPPVVAAGGIHGFAEAERILCAGEADIIASARQSLTDPDWFLKIKHGCGDQIRVCIFCNYCEALDTRHKQVTCELWDRENLDEAGVALSRDGRRRLLPPAWELPSIGSKQGK